MSLGSQIAAGRAYVELLLKDESFKAGLKKVSAVMAAWGKGIRNVGIGIAGVGSAILAPFAAAIPLFVQSGARLNDLSQRIGAPVGDLQRLGFAAEQSGTSLEEILPSLILFEKELAKSGKSGKDLVANLMAIADELKAIKDPAKRVEFMAERFGKAGAALIPLLSGGSQELGGLMGRADRLGIVMSPQDIAAAAQMDDTFAEFKETLRALGNTLAAAVIPYLQPLLEFAVMVVSTVTKWIDQNRGLAAGLAATGVALVAIGGTLVALGTVVAAVSTAIAGFTAVITFLLTPAGLVVVTIGAVIAAIVALGAILITITGQWENLGKAIQHYCELALDSLNAVMHFLQSGNWEAAGRTMALAILTGLKPIMGAGLAWLLGLENVEQDLEAMIKTAKQERAQLDMLNARPKKALPDLAGALGGANKLVQPMIGFTNSGAADRFGALTPQSAAQRSLRILAEINANIQKINPKLAPRFK